MTHRIREIKTLNDFVILVVFQDGVEKQYDMKNLFTELPQFQVLETIHGLFETVKVDIGGCGISWNDELDLSSDELWSQGETTGVIHEIDALSEVGVNLAMARDRAGITQKELAERTNVYQGDISKIERGLSNPSVKTLQRLAEGMGMKIKIDFV